MDWHQSILIGVGFFLAGVVKGATGLGFSTSALPLLTLAVGLHAAMPLVLIPSMASNAAVMIAAGHFRETLVRFGALYLALLPGLAFGLALLASVDQTIAASILGLIIIAYAALALWHPNLALPERLEARLLVPVGLVNGVVNGLTGSQILPLVPFMLSLKLGPDQFIQAVNIGFTASSLVMMIGLSQAGLLTGHAFLISVLGVIPSVAGGFAGGLIRQRLPETAFRRFVLIVLTILGVILARPLFG